LGNVKLSDADARSASYAADEAEFGRKKEGEKH